MNNLSSAQYVKVSSISIVCCFEAPVTFLLCIANPPYTSTLCIRLYFSMVLSESVCNCNCCWQLGSDMDMHSANSSVTKQAEKIARVAEH